MVDVPEKGRSAHQGDAGARWSAARRDVLHLLYMRIKLPVFVLNWYVMRMFLFIFMRIIFNLYYTNLIKNLTYQKD